MRGCEDSEGDEGRVGVGDNVNFLRRAGQSSRYWDATDLSEKTERADCIRRRAGVDAACRRTRDGSVTVTQGVVGSASLPLELGVSKSSQVRPQLGGTAELNCAS